MQVDESEGLGARLKEFIAATDSFRSPRMQYNSACMISKSCQKLQSSQVIAAEWEAFADEGWKRLKDAILGDKILFDTAKEDPDLDFLRRRQGEEFSKIGSQR